MSQIQAIKSRIEEKFPSYGINKKRELIRLFYEIAKRERRPFRKLFQEVPIDYKRYSELKNYLMKRRFPSISAAERRKNIILPDLDLDPGCRVTIKKALPQTYKNFYIEKSVSKSDLVKRIKGKFPKAKYQEIATYKDFVSQKPYTLKDYNDRTDSIFIVKEKYDFYHPCPCSPSSKRCGYHNMKLGWGCPFDCIYCFLPAYINSPGIVIPANIEDFFKAFEKYPQNIRLGTGQFTDSLVFDSLTEYSPLIIDFFRNHPSSTFEFKTKSNCVELLLQQKPASNIVVGWSLNPERIIKESEYSTASLRQRLDAAEKCVQKGFKVAFHFDPIIFYSGWERDYNSVVNRVFDLIPAQAIAWISLGTLRMTLKQKKTIESRFPNNSLLNAELIPGYDEKLRYPFKIRKEMYKQMKKWIRNQSKTIPIYLCMESSIMNKTCRILPPFRSYQ